MKVTPLEIRQKQFDKKTFGGLDKDEVQAYLNSLSLAWEKMAEEQAMLRSRLENSEREAEKLREVEASLYKTIKAAEETSQKTVEQASQQARLIVQQAKLKGETLVQEARRKAGKALEDAEEYSRKTYNEMVGQAKNLETELRHIENLKDAFLSEIKLIARDLLEKAEKAELRSAKVNFSVPPPPGIEFPDLFADENSREHADEIGENLLEESVSQASELKSGPESTVEEEITEPAEIIAHPEEKTEKKSEPQDGQNEGSFFDRIG
jgi:cell division initiation protein